MNGIINFNKYPPKSKLIVFDVDGTLTDSVGIHIQSFVETLVEMGVKNISSDFFSYKHHTDSYISKCIYESNLDLPMSKDKQAIFEQGLYQKISQYSFSEIPGACKYLQYIQYETSYCVAFATGSLRRSALYKLQSIGLEINPNLLIASDTIEDRKMIVQTAIDTAKHIYKRDTFDTILSIGDGLWDLLTARELGIDFVGIGDNHKQVLLENGATNWYRDFTHMKMKYNID